MLRIVVLLLLISLVLIGATKVIPFESEMCEMRSVFESRSPNGIFVARVCIDLNRSSLAVVSMFGSEAIPISGTLWQIPQWSNSGEMFTYSVKSVWAGSAVYTYFLYDTTTHMRQYLHRSSENIGTKWTSDETVIFGLLDRNLYCYRYFEVSEENLLMEVGTNNFQSNLLCSDISCTVVSYDASNCH